MNFMKKKKNMFEFLLNNTSTDVGHFELSSRER